jgi:hypothetical protein
MIRRLKHLRRLALASPILAGMILSQLAFASPGTAPFAQPTPFPTPTPGPDGRILYTVQQDDSLWRIAALAGISLEQLMALNGIQPGDYITPGMQLELGVGGPVQPTGAPASSVATATVPSATSTPTVGTGEICVLLFDDTNGDGRLDDGEPALAGGQINIIDIGGSLVAEYTTESLDLELEPSGFCFEDLGNADYNVSAAVPAGYNPTTGLNVGITLNPGDVKYLQFGAQPGAGLANTTDSAGRSALLGLVGAVLLLSAAGLGYYATRLGRKTPRSLR